MALTDKFRKELAAYCKEDETDAEIMAELEGFYMAAVGYLGGESRAPKEDAPLRSVWDMVVKAMVLDLHDHRGMQVESTLQENAALRKMRNQLLLTM